MSARKNKRLSLTRSLICSLLCSVLMAGSLKFEQGWQPPAEALHMLELDAGLHILYELKPEGARNQFEA